MSVDSRHAVICYSPEECVFYLKDLNTSHGTFVDDSRIPCQTYIKLHPHNKLRFGFAPDVFTLVKSSLKPTQEDQKETVQQSAPPTINNTRSNALSAREVKEEALRNARLHTKSHIFATEDILDNNSSDHMNGLSSKASPTREKNPVPRPSSIFASDSPKNRQEMDSPPAKVPPAAPTAFTISFDDEDADPVKLKNFKIDAGIRQFAPRKPSLEAPKSARKKEKQPEPPKHNHVKDNHHLHHDQQVLSDSATFLIHRMLESQESSPPEAEPSIKPGEYDSGVCDDKSESGTYTLEADHKSLDVEKARQMIDQVFGVNYVKNNAVLNSESSAESTPTNSAKRRPKGSSGAKSSCSREEPQTEGENQRTFTRSKRRGSLEEQPTTESNFSRTYSLRDKNHSSPKRGIPISPLMQRKQMERRDSVSSARSASSSRTIELEKKSSNHRHPRSTSAAAKSEPQSLVYSTVSIESFGSDPVSGADASEAQTSSLKLNRAFALRRARLGLETPGVPVNLSKDKPPKAPSDCRPGNFNRNDGGRFSLRVPSGSASGRKPPPAPSSSSQARQQYDSRKPNSSSGHWSRQTKPADGEGRRSSASSVHSEALSSQSYTKSRREASYSGHYTNRVNDRESDARGSPFMSRKNYSHQTEKRQQANVVPIKRPDIMSTSVAIETPPPTVSRSQNRVLSALDHLVVTAILQLSSKLRIGMREFSENEQLKYPAGSETRLMLQEIFPTLESRPQDTESETSTTVSKDLSNILKNLKRIEQSLEGNNTQTVCPNN